MLSHSFLKFRNHFAQVFLCLVAIIFIVNSCKKNNNQKWIDVDPGFAKYVEAYTTGVVSKTSSVRARGWIGRSRPEHGKTLPAGRVLKDRSLIAQENLPGIGTLPARHR